MYTTSKICDSILAAIVHVFGVCDQTVWNTINIKCAYIHTYVYYMNMKTFTRSSGMQQMDAGRFISPTIEFPLNAFASPIRCFDVPYFQNAFEFRYSVLVHLECLLVTIAF